MFIGGELGAAERGGTPTLPEGSFSIIDWRGYPADVPQPSGPFRLLQNPEYSAAREAASTENLAIRRSEGPFPGHDIHEVQPVKFGGAPIDHANKVLIPQALHWEVTNWWNALERAVTNR